MLSIDPWELKRRYVGAMALHIRHNLHHNDVVLKPIDREDILLQSQCNRPFCELIFFTVRINE